MSADKHVVIPMVDGPLGGQTVRVYGTVDRSFGYREFEGRYHLADRGTPNQRYVWTGPEMSFPRTCTWLAKGSKCGKPGKAVANLGGLATYVCGVHANSAEKRGHTVIRYDVKKKAVEAPSASEDY